MDVGSRGRWTEEVSDKEWARREEPAPSLGGFSRLD